MSAASTEGTGTGPPPAPGTPDPQTLEREIEQTREQLGATVAKLAAKADVKARAKDKARELTGQLKASAGKASRAGSGTAGRATRPLQRTGATARRQPVLLAVAVGGAAVSGLLIAFGLRRPARP